MVVLMGAGQSDKSVYAKVAGRAQEMNINLGIKRTIPFRDDYKYFLQPWKHNDHSPQQFAEHVFSVTAKDAVIYADSTSIYPLWHGTAIEGKRPDIQIVAGYIYNNEAILGEEKIADLLAHKPIYIISPVKGYCPAHLLVDYDFAPAGKLWRVTARRGANAIDG